MKAEDKQIWLTSWSYIGKRGMGNPLGWKEGIPKKQRFRWKDISGYPMEGFGRMDLLSKYVLGAVELLGLPHKTDLEKQTLKAKDKEWKEKIKQGAFFLATTSGCLNVDTDFFTSITDPGGARPRLFTYTLPTVGLGEISRHYGFMGINYAFLADSSSPYYAFCQALALLEEGKIPCALVLYSEALTEKSFSFCKGLWEEEKEICFSMAFLLEIGKKEACYFSPLAFITKKEAPMGDPLTSFFDLCTCLQNKKKKERLYFSDSPP
ncbi:MAG: hypothetical protein D6785_10320, partial [Planctomycetota bacterium]